jgi:hypothetical protein
MAITDSTTSGRRATAPRVYLEGARGPASLDQRKRAQERIDRLWYCTNEYFVAPDDDLTLEDLNGGVKVLAMRVQHLEAFDDRYTVYVTPTKDGHNYDCQTPSCFQEPVAPLVIELVQAAIDRMIAGKLRWAR